MHHSLQKISEKLMKQQWMMLKTQIMSNLLEYSCNYYTMTGVMVYGFILKMTQVILIMQLQILITSSTKLN